MSTPLIIYHASCADGMTAAWIANQAFPGGCDLVPAQYGEDPPSVKGRDVLVLDFSYPREVMVQMSKDAHQLRVFDHHKTAAEACAGLPFCLFDMEKSGARLIWEYFFPNLIPRAMVEYIEDSDLWRFALPQSREVRAFVQSFPFTLNGWDELMDTRMDDAKKIGESLLRYRTQKIESYILAHAKTVDWTVEFGTTLSVVVLQTPVFISDACHMALERFTSADFAAALFRTGTGEWVHSLRSRIWSEIDVGAIAKAHGGGGHKHAAGFTADVPHI